MPSSSFRLLGALLLLCAVGTVKAAGPPSVLLVSASATGSGNAKSYFPVISANGRVVAFTSQATDLVPEVAKVSTTVDLFARDLQTGQIVDLNSVGSIPGNSSAGQVSLSADGRYAAFTSGASNLVPSDNNGTSDVFVRDLKTRTTILVSCDAANMGTANGRSEQPSISADGRYVAFMSSATNLAAGDTNATYDIYVRDLLLGTTRLVSASYSGAGSADGHCYAPRITADGRHVLFLSQATNLWSSRTAGYENLYRRDLVNRKTDLVSVSKWGGESVSYTPIPFDVTPDGRFVAFESSSNQLVEGLVDTIGSEDVFVRDLVERKTTLVSINQRRTGTGNGRSQRPTVSADGNWIAFESSSSDLTPADHNNLTDVFVYDLSTGKATLVSVNPAGVSGNWYSTHGQVSGDGRFVTFWSAASDLTPGKERIQYDIYQRDLYNRTTRLVSQNPEGHSGNDSSDVCSTSSDGRIVAFTSRATDLVANDTNGPVDDIFAGTVNSAPAAGPNSFFVPRDVARTVLAPGVLRDDLDREASTLTAVIASQPQSGHITLRPDGSFTYTPNPGFVGTDRFTYQASDGADLSAPASVELLVGTTLPSTPRSLVAGTGTFGRGTSFTVTATSDFSGRTQGTLQTTGAEVSLQRGTVTSVVRNGSKARVYGRGTLVGYGAVDFLLETEDVAALGAGRDCFRLLLGNGLEYGPYRILRGDITVK